MDCFIVKEKQIFCRTVNWLVSYLPSDWSISSHVVCSLIGRSAHGETRVGRFQNVTELRLAGLDLSDASSRMLVRYVPRLTRLDLSQCGSITDQTVHTLTSPISPLRETLTHINLAGKSKINKQKKQVPIGDLFLLFPSAQTKHFDLSC